VRYSTFCPKAIGMKGLYMPDTTASRSIIIRLVPKLASEQVEEFKFEDDDDFLTSRRKALRWAGDVAEQLKNAEPAMPFGFTNRPAASWRLLFAISDLAGGNFPKRARNAAPQLLVSRENSGSEGIRLLTALQTIFQSCKLITSDDLQRMLTLDDEGEWSNFRGRGPISKRQVAVLLEPFGLRPKVIHPQRGSTAAARGYQAEWFTEAFARYLPPTAATVAKRTSVQPPHKKPRK
jgi:hypothetical protein